MMALLRVRMFGVLSVQNEHGHIEGLTVRKVQEVLCYLLLHRERGVPREVLAGQLWAETTTAQSRANLRKALWRLQCCLHAHISVTRPLLLMEQGCLQVNPAAQIWSDVEIFAQAYRAVADRPGENLRPEEARPVEAAVALYHGHLLDGWYQDWCLAARDRYQAMYLTLLDKLMGYCEAQQLCERGLAYGEQALRCDRAQEPIYRRLMRLHLLAGDRTAALRQFERCTTVLNTEFGVEPAEATCDVYQQVKCNQLASTTRSTPERAPERSIIALHRLLDDLHHMDATLRTLERRVRGQIETLELAAPPAA